MKKRHYLLSVLTLILAVMLFVSCAPARRPGNYPQPTPGTRQTRFVPRNAPNRPPMPAPNPGPLTQQRRYNPNRTGNQMGTTVKTNDMHDRARKIADEAAKQKDVKSASCVITGNTALVGLELNKQSKGKLTDSIKTEVEKKVMAKDTRIKNVVVTADPNMVTRIETMFRDIGKGKPISGFADEIKEMINRIKPKAASK